MQGVKNLVVVARNATMDCQGEVLLSVFLVSLVVWWWYSSKTSNAKLPPGPKGVPVLGNLRMLGKQPYRSLRDLSKKHGSIMYLRLGSVPTVVASNAEAAKLFCKTHDLAFSSRPDVMLRRCIYYNNEDMALAGYGEGWRHRRKICTLEVFSSRRVDSFRGIREEEATLMVQKLWRNSSASRGQAVNLTQAFAAFPYDNVWRAIARKDFSHMSSELINLISEVVALMLKGSISDYIPWLGFFEFGRTEKKMRQVFNKFDDFAERVIQEHIALGKPLPNDRKCFMDVLLAISEEDPNFTHYHIKALLLDMVIPTSSIASTLEWTVSLLLKNPHCIRKLQEEVDNIVGTEEKVNESHLSKMKYMKCIAKESMRLYPAAPMGFFRESIETTTVNGYVLPKGTRLLVNLWAIGRDPDAWEKPEEFIPERHYVEGQDEVDFVGWTDFKAIPFGAGRRSCPAWNMAVITVLLGVSTIFHAFDVNVQGDASKLDMSEKVATGVPRENPLFCCLKLRPHASKVYLGPVME